MRVSIASKILTYFLLGTFVVSCLTMLLIGAVYSQPNAEDFSLTLLPRDLGILNSVRYVMASYDGRYFTNVLHALNPLACNWVSGYKVMAPFSILFFVFALFIFIQIITNATKSLAFIISLLFSIIHFITVPSLVHQIYWMVSSFVYLYSWSFTLLFFAAYHKYVGQIQKGNNAYTWFFIASFLLLSTIGINEMFLPLLFIVLVTQIYLCRSEKYFPHVLAICLVGFIGMAFFCASPGIGMRVEGEQGTSKINYISNLSKGLWDYVAYLKSFFCNPFILLSSVLWCVYKGKLVLEPFFLLPQKVSHLVLWVAVIILGYFMLVPYYIFMGQLNAYPERLFNVINILLLLTLIHTLSGFKLADNFKNSLGFGLSLSLLIFLFACNNNVTALYADYRSGAMKKFDMQMIRRYEILQLSNINSTHLFKKIALDSLVNPPRTIWIGPDIVSKNPADKEGIYWNHAYQQYFKQDEVYLK